MYRESGVAIDLARVNTALGCVVSNGVQPCK